MRTWNALTIDWYLRAGQHSQYPGTILENLLPLLRPCHTVLDIGCGPGLWALAMAPHVKKVLAIDREAIVLGTLKVLSRKHGLSNICCQKAEWPEVKVQDKVHVILSAFSSGQVMTNRASITRMLSMDPELIIMVAPGDYLPPFGSSGTAGPHPSARDTIGILEEMHVSYSLHNMKLDFGQPVLNFAEAAAFLSRFLKISLREAREQAEKIALSHPHGLYLPNPRNVVLIIIQ